MVRRKVLLPPPDGPMITTTSPLYTVRSTPFSTWFWPKCLCTPRASTTGRALVFIAWVTKTAPRLDGGRELGAASLRSSATEREA